MTKNLLWSLAESEREKKFWKVFEKVVRTSQIWIFQKPYSRNSIDRDNSFDWLKQTEASFKILKQFRLIEKQIGSIETDRGFLKTF